MATILKQHGATSREPNPRPAAPPREHPPGQPLPSTSHAAPPLPRNGLAVRLPADSQGASASGIGAGLSGLAGFNLEDFADRGREQLRRCQAQVEQQLELARQEAQQIHADADQRGYEEGLRRAAEDAEAKIARQAESKARSQLQSLHQAVAKMHAQYDQWMKQYAEVLTQTALACTERIVQGQLEREANRHADQHSERHAESSDTTAPPTNVSLIVRWAGEALHSTRSASRLTLAVHPDTLAELGGSLDELLAHPDLPEQSTVIPDENLAVGDVVVRQDGGEIQAGLKAQLQRLREELAG